MWHGRHARDSTRKTRVPHFSGPRDHFKIARAGVFPDPGSRIDHKLFQRHHGRFTFVLIATVARNVDATFAWCAFPGTGAADVDGVINAGVLGFAQIGCAALRDLVEVNRQIRKGRVCCTLNGQRRRRRFQRPAERKRGHDDYRHRD